MDRECKKFERLAIIRQHACELVIAHGYDGFTMTDLAVAAGISRRTLFNSVSDKASAILGMKEDIIARMASHSFASGGPTGRFSDDLINLLEITFVFLGPDEAAGRAQRLFAQAVSVDPKVMQLATERGNEVTEVIRQLICQRTGWAPGDLQTQILVAHLSTLVNLTLQELATRAETQSVIPLLHEVLCVYREVIPLLIPSNP